MRASEVLGTLAKARQVAAPAATVAPALEKARRIYPTRVDWDLLNAAAECGIFVGPVRGPVTLPASTRRRAGRAPRSACNARRKGSRRTSARVRAGPGDDPESEPPPRLRLWRHSRWGDCTPNLIRVLMGAAVS